VLGKGAFMEPRAIPGGLLEVAEILLGEDTVEEAKRDYGYACDHEEAALQVLS
jgi:hypothetical protein